MHQKDEKKLEAFGVTVTIAMDNEMVNVVITKEESVQLNVTKPSEPEHYPWSGCGAMC